MFTTPQITVHGLDCKGTQALEALTSLQTQVLSSSSQRDFKPSQSEIARICLLIFKARVNNQPQLNQWFSDSIHMMVDQVTLAFNHDDDSALLSHCLAQMTLLTKFIYFSAVFIFDKQNRLFTLGIQVMRERLVEPIIPKLIPHIISITRSLEVGCSVETVLKRLLEAAQVLEMIRACGWQDLSIVKERSGKLVLLSNEVGAKNTLFSESFEKPYVECLRTTFNQITHKIPLAALSNQIDHEHKILSVLAPQSEAIVMDQIEADSILRVVKDLDLTQMIEHNQDEEVKSVVQLFQKVVADTVDQCAEFVLGTQFHKPAEHQEFPIKSFRILAVSFRLHLIEHAPSPLNVQSLTLYIQKYEDYVARIFSSQADMKLVLREAIEVVANSDPNLCQSIITHLLTQLPMSSRVVEIVPYLHQPQFFSGYARGLLQTLGQSVNPFRQSKFIEGQLEILTQLRLLFTHQSIEWFKVSELVMLCQSFKSGLDHDEKISIQVPSYCDIELEVISVSLLPASLQTRFTSSEAIILDYGYSIAEFNNYKLILSTTQLILLMIIDARETTSLEDLLQTFGRNSNQFGQAFSALKASRLLEETQEQIRIRDNWQPAEGKNTTVLIDQ